MKRPVPREILKVTTDADAYVKTRSNGAAVVVIIPTPDQMLAAYGPTFSASDALEFAEWAASELETFARALRASTPPEIRS